MKAEYEALLAAGRPAKVALVAIVRKLLILAKPSSATAAPGPPNSLDQHGYSSRQGRHCASDRPIGP